MKQILIRSHAALRRQQVPGGAEHLIQNIARALDEEGWNVEILCPRPPDDGGITPGSVTYHEFAYTDPNSGGEKLLNTVRGATNYRSVISDPGHDVILDNVAHMPYYPAHFLSSNTTTNAVFLHMAFFEEASHYLGPVKGHIINLIDRTIPYLNNPEIVCAGRGTESRVNSKLGYWNTQILNPCINIKEYDYTFEPDSKTVLYLGRLGVQKDVGTLLKAWRLVERETTDLQLVVAGSGPQEAELKQLAGRLGLERVQFPGYVSDTEKRALFSDALLYVLPSKIEGYVTTGLEAMASGTPILGSDTVGINDYVSDNETGYLFPVGEHMELAERLLTLSSEPEQMQPVAERARELAATHSYADFRLKADRVFSAMC